MLLTIVLVIMTDIAITLALTYRIEKPSLSKVFILFGVLIIVFIPAIFFFEDFTAFLVSNLFSYFSITIIFMHLFKKSIFKSIISVVIAMMPMYILSFVFWIIFTVGLKIYDIGIFSYPMASWEFTLILFVLYITVYFKMPLKKMFAYFDEYDVIFSFILTNSILYLVSYADTILYVLDGEKGAARFQIILISISILINFILVLSYLNRSKKVSKQIEYAELKHKISPFIENSLRIQHDYKNHLNVIKTFLDDENQNVIKMVDRASKYIDRHNEHLKWENPLFSALVKRKSVEAYNKKIPFTTISYGVDDQLPLDDFSLITIVANLLDNAFEATGKLPSEDRKVSLEVGKDIEYHIIVTNTAHIDFMIMKNMFKKGYSTNGDGRGIGLYSVERIVAKNKGIINVYPTDDSVSIKLIFPSVVKNKKITKQRSVR